MIETEIECTSESFIIKTERKRIHPYYEKKKVCYGNAITETFPHTLKTVSTYNSKYRTREVAR